MLFANTVSFDIPDNATSFAAVALGVLNFAVLMLRRRPAAAAQQPSPAAALMASHQAEAAPTPARKWPELRYVLATFLMLVGAFLVGDAVVLAHLLAFDITPVGSWSPMASLGTGAACIGGAAISRYAG